MLRSWDFLDHGEERINPILRHLEQLTVNSSLRVNRQFKLCDSTDKNCSQFTGYWSLKKKAAFTLAEVLITLGIIGVVAALTLPTLIANYQKKVYVNQLKKSVSVLSNGFKLMMAHDGVTELKDTEAFSGMNTSTCMSNNWDSDDCKSLREGLKNTFSSITFTNENISYKTLSGHDISISDVVIHFPDGSYISSLYWLKNSAGTQSGLNGTMKGYLGSFLVDVNGYKKPNIVGRDIFYLYVGNVGGVYPMGSQAVSSLFGDENAEYWRNSSNSTYSCKSDGSSAGYGCAARVLEEDAMNY